MKRKLLNKPNQLIGLKTSETITATQRKIYNVFLAIAQQKVKFNDFGEIDKDKTYWFEVDYKNTHRVAGANNRNLKYIEQQLDDLMKIIVTLREEDNPDDWKEKFSLLPKMKKEDGKYKFMLIGNIVKALKEQNYFTHLDLIRMQNLKSQYSVVFYELAIRYQKVEIPKMSIEKIREITNTQNEYKRFYDFKRRVLDQACNETSEKTDIILSYKTEKKGRKIAYIKFKIERKPDKILKKLNEDKPKGYSPKVLELFELLPKNEQVESNKETLDNLLENYEFKYIKADIEYAKQFKPQNFMGFLKSSCDAGHYGKPMLEKREKEKELAKKRKEKKRQQKKAKEELKERVKQMALTRYKQLSQEEKEKYSKGYKSMSDIVPATLRPSKEEYIIGQLEKKIKENLYE